MLFDERLKQLRLQMNAVRRALTEFEAQAELAKERFGLPTRATNKDDVVDIGPPTGVLTALGVAVKRTAQGCLLAASFALLGVALLSLGMFAGAAALAFVVITRGLGLRVIRPAV